MPGVHQEGSAVGLGQQYAGLPAGGGTAPDAEVPGSGPYCHAARPQAQGQGWEAWHGHMAHSVVCPEAGSVTKHTADTGWAWGSAKTVMLSCFTAELQLESQIL